jgi:hypothetical protein
MQTARNVVEWITQVKEVTARARSVVASPLR